MNTTDLQSELNETLRKIGRNVLNFQKMEAMLKYLVSHSNIEGEIKDVAEIHKKKIDSVSKKTMGNLVKDFVASVYSDKINEAPTSESLDKNFFKFSFATDAEPAYVENKKLTLEHIVTERNALIHQTLLSFDPMSIESCRKLNVILDEQDERIKTEYEEIREQAKVLHEGKKEIIEALIKDTEK